MTLPTSMAGILIYTFNALVAADPTKTTSDVADASEISMLDYLVAEGIRVGVDVSLLEHWYQEDPDSKLALDDMFMRWVNASGTGQYLLPSEVNGWLWLSSISVDALFVARDPAVSA